MSGIVGIWNRDGRPVSRSDLSRLCATLAHRGDSEALEIRGPVGLGCRLSRITPEAVAEVQPVVDSSGTMLVFDGRLDNRDELIAALPHDLPVTGDSPDSRLALAAYRAFGDGFPERLNGDFALGLFDPARSKMLLARDPIGLRPIHYYADGTLFLFASEVKTLLAHENVSSGPDDDVLADLLLRRLACEDLRGVTVFKNIFSVLPAHAVRVSADRVVTERYWDFDQTHQIRLESFEEFAEAFHHHFRRAVRRRMRSAGPVAVSVSGGLDSSAIFCVAETLRRSESGHPALLGVSYTWPDGSPADEKAFLREIERTYGLAITRFDDLPVGIMDACDKAVWHGEAPLLDAQWNATHTLLTALRPLGARVLLTGHWGDQFLFEDAYLVDLCRRGSLWEAWRHVHEFGQWVDVPHSLFKGRLLRTLLRYHAPDAVVSALRRVRNRVRRTEDVRPWYTASFRDRASGDTDSRHRRQASATAHAQSLYREARSRYHVLCMEWNNKIGAMHGLDMAYPFLDRDLIAFLMAIPGEIQCWKGRHKGILRAALKGILPEAIAARTSKADFTGVVNEGMVKDYERVGQHLHPGAMVAALGYVRAMELAETGRRKQEIRASTCETTWALGDLLFLELWLQEFFGSAGVHLGMEVC